MAMKMSSIGMTNFLSVLLKSTPYSVLQFSILSTGVFQGVYWSIPYYVLGGKEGIVDAKLFGICD